MTAAQRRLGDRCTYLYGLAASLGRDRRAAGGAVVIDPLELIDPKPYRSHPTSCPKCRGDVRPHYIAAHLAAVARTTEADQ